MRKLILCSLVLGVFALPLDAYEPARAITFNESMAHYRALLRAQKEAAERKVAEEKARKERMTNTLIRVSLNPQTPESRYAYLLERGADACAALLPAVRADNAPAVTALNRYRESCDWAPLREKALKYAMHNDKFSAFGALTQEEGNCPEPFDFNPRVEGSRWKPLSTPMLHAVTSRCYRSAQERQDFLKDSVIRLNPGDRSIFWLGDAYERGITGPQMTRRWLGTVKQLVDARIRVSDRALWEVVALGRSPSIYGDAFLPFSVTRELVILSLKGGANGKQVLADLDKAEDNWIWKKYNREERKRLSNLLEGRPENEDRNLGDRVHSAYQRVKSWF